MKKKITFIRHAESYHNYYKKYGFNIDQNKLIDCGITNFGKTQAKKLNQQFDILLVSPLKRTKETLIFSNIKADKIIYEELFRERRLDICDFKEDEDIIVETEDEFLIRVNKAKYFLKNINYKNIGVITHSDFIWLYSSYEIDGERFGQWIDNCELYTKIIN